MDQEWTWTGSGPELDNYNNGFMQRLKINETG